MSTKARVLFKRIRENYLFSNSLAAQQAGVAFPQGNDKSDSNEGGEKRPEATHWERERFDSRASRR